eukprot:2282491-Rhodomonas_salina.1
MHMRAAEQVRRRVAEQVRRRPGAQRRGGCSPGRGAHVPSPLRPYTRVSTTRASTIEPVQPEAAQPRPYASQYNRASTTEPVLAKRIRVLVLERASWY